MVLVRCIRPRSAYQVMRFVPDSPKLLLTCTTRGRMRLYTLELRLTKDGWVEKPILVDDASEQCLYLNRASKFYDIVKLSNELRGRATRKRPAR